MWNYLHRWKVANALHHLGRKHGMVVWVPEYQLCAWVSGIDMKTHIGIETSWEKLRYKFWYWYFKVENHDQLFQKIHNVLYDMEHIEPAWIRRTKGDDGISDQVALSPRGNEIYAFSHLWLTSEPALKVWTAVLAGLLIWFATERVGNITSHDPIRIEPIEVEVEVVYPPTVNATSAPYGKG